METNSSTQQTQALHITILAVGSRGDVQPYCALALGLQRAGYRVRIATHYNFEEFVSQLGLEFAPISGNYQELLQSEAGQKLLAGQPNNLSPLPILYGFSPSVIPKPADWADWLNVTGYWFLDQATTYQPPKELLDFINDGSPPVCIGFGSMTSSNPQSVTEVLLEALAHSQQRGILLSGWAGIGNVKMPNHVFVIDSVPHDWLFPRMAAVVHHGGANTTAAGLRAGVPSVIVPFFADQPVWGQRLADLGVSPPPVLFKELSAQALATAIQVAVSDEEMRSRAEALGRKIREEDGVANAVAAFQHYLKELEQEV